jgi:NDP-sugar pyrophosphorylase family protein
MTKPLQLLIPAAGKGSRFADVGVHLPKPLIPIWGIPMLIWVISNFPLNAKDEIKILCQGIHGIPNALKKYTDKFPYKIDFIEIDYWTDGPAHSLELLLEGLEDSSPVICANSDQYIFAGLPEYVDAVRHGNSQGQILTMEATSNAWSYIGRDLNGKVNRVVEKEEISNEATVGVYGWDSAATLRAALSWQRTDGIRVNNEYYVAPSYQYLIDNALDISTHSVGEHGIGVHGLGVPKDLSHFSTLESAREIYKKIFPTFS